MKEIEAAEKKLALDSNTHLIMQLQGNLKTGWRGLYPNIVQMFHPILDQFISP